MNTEDLIGKKFGRLTVIKFDGIEHKRDDKGKNRDKGFWLCKCECGNLKRVDRNALICGHTKSCGCLSKEVKKKISKNRLVDLTGRQFGKLIVTGLERTEINKIKKGNATTYFWRCRCDCGKEVIANGRHLREGRINSCEDVIRNSQKSYMEIGNEFKKENILKEGTRLDYLSGISKANTSGVRGVNFSKSKNKYRARIYFKGKEYHLGYFNTVEKAELARKKAEEKYFKPILEKYNYKSKKERKNEEEFE